MNVVQREYLLCTKARSSCLQREDPPFVQREDRPFCTKGRSSLYKEKILPLYKGKMFPLCKGNRSFGRNQFSLCTKGTYSLCTTGIFPLHKGNIPLCKKRILFLYRQGVAELGGFLIPILRCARPQEQRWIKESMLCNGDETTTCTGLT